MDDLPLTGPIEPRLGRWMLERLVATAVRYGHPFAIVLARTPVPEATAERLTCGCDYPVDQPLFVAALRHCKADPRPAERQRFFDQILLDQPVTKQH